MENKNIGKEKSYWESFYAKAELEMPSQFCILLASEVNKKNPVVEFGCGNGRDSIFLAEHGYNIFALDASEVAIDKCNKKKNINKNATFFQGDIVEENDVYNLIKSAKKICDNIIIYSRFFLHTISNEQEEKFLTYLSNHLDCGDKIYFEFRDKEDRNLNKIFQNHYRRYIDSNTLTFDLEKKYYFNINYQITGKGMAKYHEEDPIVSRIIATRV